MDQITDRDVRDYVTEALGAMAAECDVDAIARELIAEHGMAADYEPVDFWATVQRHEIHPGASGAEAFRAELTESMHRAKIGKAARWSDGTVTVTVTGMSRVAHTWPQPMAHLTITAPDGTTDQIDGWDLASWDELWARVETAGREWATVTDTLLEHLAGAHRGYEKAASAADAARSRRDALVRQASAAGVSAYRIAKRLGVAESTVGRILARQ